MGATGAAGAGAVNVGVGVFTHRTDHDVDHIDRLQ